MRPSSASSAGNMRSGTGGTSFLIEPSTSLIGLFCGHHLTTCAPPARLPSQVVPGLDRGGEGGGMPTTATASGLESDGI